MELYQRSTEVVGRDNQISRFIATSPLRKEGEKRNRKDFERVRSRYLVKGKGRVRQNWYEGNLRELATKINREDEYVVLSGLA